MNVAILPSAIADLIRGRFFHDRIESGLGLRFLENLMAEIDRLETTAGIHELHFGYHRALANRFHQNIYYKLDGGTATVWRILDQRFDPKRIESALHSSQAEE